MGLKLFKEGLTIMFHGLYKLGTKEWILNIPRVTIQELLMKVMGEPMATIPNIDRWIIRKFNISITLSMLHQKSGFQRTLMWFSSSRTLSSRKNFPFWIIFFIIQIRLPPL